MRVSFLCHIVNFLPTWSKMKGARRLSKALLNSSLVVLLVLIGCFTYRFNHCVSQPMSVLEYRQDSRF